MKNKFYEKHIISGRHIHEITTSVKHLRKQNCLAKLSKKIKRSHLVINARCSKQDSKRLSEYRKNSEYVLEIQIYNRLKCIG